MNVRIGDTLVRTLHYGEKTILVCVGGGDAHSDIFGPRPTRFFSFLALAHQASVYDDGQVIQEQLDTLERGFRYGWLRLLDSPEMTLSDEGRDIAILSETRVKLPQE